MSELVTAGSVCNNATKGHNFNWIFTVKLVDNLTAGAATSPVFHELRLAEPEGKI